MKTPVLLLAVAILLAGNLFSQDLPDESTALLEKLTEWETEKRTALEEEIREKKSQVADALAAHLESETKKGNLETAVAIKAKIDELRGPVETAEAPKVMESTGKTYRSLRDFESTAEFGKWLMTTQWKKDNGEEVISFPEPGKRLISRPGDAIFRNLAKIEIPEVGSIVWNYSTGGSGVMRVHERLETGTHSDGTPLTRIELEPVAE